jgi:hypothetical protein
MPAAMVSFANATRYALGRPPGGSGQPPTHNCVHQENFTGGQARGSGNSATRPGRVRVAPAGGLRRTKRSPAGPESNPPVFVSGRNVVEGLEDLLALPEANTA